MTEAKNTNCLLKAMSLMSPKYSATIAILPLVFLILELIKVIYELWIPDKYADASDTIRNWRIILSSITSALFLLIAFGGAIKYSEKESLYNDMAVWWIIEGIAGFGAFLTLAVFQYKDFPAGGEIYESVWFWFGMIWLISFLCWVALTRGRLKLPDDHIWLTIKIVALIIIGFWLGYRPADTKYDNASFVIFTVIIILAFMFVSRKYKVKDSNKSWWYTAVTLWFVLPIILIILSFWKQGDGDTLGYVYFSALIVTIVAYIIETGAYFIKGFKLIKADDEYNLMV